jgi:riboflavin kinase/FMN adenylyltransferase
MELVQGLPLPINERPTVLTIGAFDGVHFGHQQLIGSVVRRAQTLGYQSAVLTFDPHPDLVIRPERGRYNLTTIQERAEQIAQLGVDLLIVLPFNRDVMAQTAHEFMTRLTQALVLRELWVGPDFALGRGREGNLARLREIGQELGYIVQPIEPLHLDGVTISSSRIREALAAGDIEAANLLLGRSFSVTGPVVEGHRRGRTIGFPTANISVEALHVLPADGVYVCRAQVGDQRFGAVTNIGVRPTFDGTQRTIEAYLLDFSSDIYGETVRLEFLHRLRGEQKFDGIAALIEQINKDTAAARAWLAAHPE